MIDYESRAYNVGIKIVDIVHDLDTKMAMIYYKDAMGTHELEVASSDIKAYTDVFKLIMQKG